MRLFTRKMSTISLRVSYQGQPSAYTYLAAKEYFNQKDIEINFEPCNNLKKVFNDIINGDSNYGFVPLESSSMGTIHGVYDMLLAHSSKVSIVGEFGRIEDHCLCARDNKEINELSVTSVICHPHILDCCSDYLDALDVRRQEKGFPTLIRESSWNSAAACCKVAEKEADAAAIGSVEAAQLYKLKIIASGIGNDKNAEVYLTSNC